MRLKLFEGDLKREEKFVSLWCAWIKFYVQIQALVIQRVIFFQSLLHVKIG